ncbi:FecR family protein [Aestuariivivens sediminis]|uniref:FecR family protein n=1 Tax=Aestuariivivens sediminis TaxID=2913557 RepID=UPI001F563E10|nr:FecR family protein [Aestuariivivens sediminis]
MNKANIYLKISELISLKLNGAIDKKAEDQLNDWLEESQENQQIYYDIIKEGWYQSNVLDQNKFKVDEGWYEVKLRVKSKPKLIRLVPNVWKYAAAAILVGVLATTYFFKDRLFNPSVDNTVTPTITNTKPIEPGTDKAVLTLEDGSQIALEKGNAIQTQNAISNGEALVYKNKEVIELVYNYLTVPRGGQFVIELSDGTKVWLNSESQLKYPVNFMEGQTREVELVYGEAYFDVSPSTEHNGAKFKVLNKAQEVEVLGTEFNIKAYRDETNIYTTLVEGKVMVGYNGKRQKLAPSFQSVLDISNHTVSVAKVNVQSVISWKEGIFSFIDMPLKDIMKVISRWYDVDVIFENKALETIEFIGVLDKKLSIDEILSIIKSTSINDYTIDNKTITLK